MSNASRPVNLPSILRTVERSYLVTVFLTMVTLFFVNIVVRTLAPGFASNLAWVEEAVRLLNLFLVFGGLGLALERGRHVSIDNLCVTCSACQGSQIAASQPTQPRHRRLHDCTVLRKHAGCGRSVTHYLRP